MNIMLETTINFDSPEFKKKSKKRCFSSTHYTFDLGLISLISVERQFFAKTTIDIPV